MASTMKSAAIGALTGFVNGMFGAGGGTVLVPAMQKFLRIETHKSHATAIAIILPLSVLSAVVYLRAGQIDWMIVMYVSAGGVLGGYIGAKLLNKISSPMLHKIFGAFMMFAALRMITG